MVMISNGQVNSKSILDNANSGPIPKCQPCRLNIFKNPDVWCLQISICSTLGRITWLKNVHKKFDSFSYESSSNSQIIGLDRLFSFGSLIWFDALFLASVSIGFWKQKRCFCSRIDSQKAWYPQLSLQAFEC